MFKYSILTFFAVLIFSACDVTTSDFYDYNALKQTAFEKSKGKTTSTYFEAIAYYEYLDSLSTNLQLHNIGNTDSPEPLHLMLWSYNGKTTLEEAKNRGDKALIFINNGIHPGEPDGIDACQLLLKKLISDSAFARKNQDIVLAIIPIYNVGGSINRNSTTRVNQNGPKAYGFRGNAHNYDLNRDFIKMDSKNAWSFTQAFSTLKPNVFIDTHVSNGADYPYNITLLSNHKNKFQSGLESFMQNTFTPALYKDMLGKNEKMIPYVNVHGTDPSMGINEFLDHPRYSNGYAALHHCPAYTIETHMLKSHKVRTDATYKLLETFLSVTKNNKSALLNNIENEMEWYQNAKELPISYTMGNVEDSLRFEGYKYESEYSKTFEQDLMVYNRANKYAQKVPFYNNYNADNFIKKPKQYIVQGGYHQVINRLRSNGVDGRFLTKDSTVSLSFKEIANSETLTQPFEGHYLHYNTTGTEKTEKWLLRKGDFIIDVADNNARFLAEVLEIEAPDSYFNWNFFDIILQQKEHFSAYVWQKEAEDMLKNDNALKAEFESKKAKDVLFANSFNDQLYWLYKKSEHYEKAYKRVPIYKIY